LTSVTVTNTWKSGFAYDGLGRLRVARDYIWNLGTWSLINETRYVYDGMLVLQERDSGNNAVVSYTRGLDLSGTMQGAGLARQSDLSRQSRATAEATAGGIGGLLARTDAGGSAFYHADARGNITTMVDASGNEVARYLYDPFGRLLGKWGMLADANRYRFSSKELHPSSGLYYYGFRFYEPNLQRWVNQDPIGERGGINLYAFVGNDPVNFVDPLGLLDYYYSGGGLLQPSGPVPYLEGDSWYEQLGSALYNTIPVAANALNKLAPGDIGTGVGAASADGNYLGMLMAAAMDAAGMLPGGKCEKASEKAAKAMAKKIGSDLGPAARRIFHDLKESGAGNRTMDQLRADAREVYELFGSVPPKWMQ
jgi:RHS repeat-associated protein